MLAHQAIGQFQIYIQLSQLSCLHWNELSWLRQYVYSYPYHIIALLCPCQLRNEIHWDMLSFPLQDCQWLKQPRGFPMFSLDLLTYETSRDKLCNIPLHIILPITVLQVDSVPSMMSLLHNFSLYLLVIRNAQSTPHIKDTIFYSLIFSLIFNNSGSKGCSLILWIKVGPIFIFMITLFTHRLQVPIQISNVFQ